MAKPVKVQEIAQLLKLTERRVQQLVREGVLPTPTRGIYHPVKCVHGYIDYLKGISDGTGEATLTDERTRLIRTQADLAEIDLMKARGELIPTSKARAAWTVVIQGIRQKLLAIPTRLAARVASVKSIPQAKEIIEEAVREVLNECTNPDLAKLGRMESDQRSPNLFSASAEAEGERLGRPEEEAEPGVERGTGPVDDPES